MEAPFFIVDVRARILVQVIEVPLRTRRSLGLNSPKLRQEYVEDLPAERKCRRWSTGMIFMTNSSGERCQINERSVVQEAIEHPLILRGYWRADVIKLSNGGRIVVRKEELIDWNKRRRERRAVAVGRPAIRRDQLSQEAPWTASALMHDARRAVIGSSISHIVWKSSMSP